MAFYKSGFYSNSLKKKKKLFLWKRVIALLDFKRYCLFSIELNDESVSYRISLYNIGALSEIDQ